MKNRYKTIDIIFCIAWLFLVVFEVVKVCIWGSHRPLAASDIVILTGGGEQVLIFVLWLIFALKYETNGRFRKTTIIFFIICSAISIGYIYSKIHSFKLLFFPSEYYNPVFIDQFTTLFELCWVSLFAITFTTYFVILLCKKHFKELS